MWYEFAFGDLFLTHHNTKHVNSVSKAAPQTVSRSSKEIWSILGWPIQQHRLVYTQFKHIFIHFFSVAHYFLSARAFAFFVYIDFHVINVFRVSNISQCLSLNGWHTDNTPTNSLALAARLLISNINKRRAQLRLYSGAAFIFQKCAMMCLGGR